MAINLLPLSPLLPFLSFVIMASPSVKYRMIALDLDGTLLNSKHELTDTMTAYLRKLHDRGIIVAIATGRSAACTAHIIKKLNLPPASNGSGGFPVVCSNGARGIRVLHKAFSSALENCSACDEKSEDEPTNSDAANPFLNETLIIDEELFHTPLDLTLTKKTLTLAHHLGCVTNYYQNHHIYAVVRNDDHVQFTQRYANLTASKELYRYLNPTNNYQDNEHLYTTDNYYGYEDAVKQGPPSKLLIVCDTESLDDITDSVNKELNGESDNGTVAKVIRGSPPFFVEILSPQVHKGHGLRQLCQNIGVSLDEVIAFGDGDNDIEFLQLAGRGVAMKNARSTLKAVADEITEFSNDEFGVMKMLEQYEAEGKLALMEK